MLEVKRRATVVVPFLVIALVMAVTGWLGMAWVRHLGVVWFIACLSVMVSSVPMVVLGIIKALDRRPVLRVDAGGLHDRATSPARQFPWGEIKGFRLSPANTRAPQVLAIDVVDPARAIEAAPLGARTLMEAARLHHGTPCIIWLRALDIDANALLAALRSLQVQYTSPYR